MTGVSICATSAFRILVLKLQVLLSLMQVQANHDLPKAGSHLGQYQRKVLSCVLPREVPDVEAKLESPKQDGLVQVPKLLLSCLEDDDSG
ncbi:hypothetical protein V8C44DRAFT_332355 [Trichoderma aethiopicum]